VTDISSTDLWMQATCGKSLGDCKIHFMQTGGTDVKQQPYLIIVLTEAIVSSYSMSSSGERPSESFSLNFTKISYQYDEFDGKTRTTGTPKIWDLKNNAIG
jgi:type VI secretion system secreted protein Hcp